MVFYDESKYKTKIFFSWGAEGGGMGWVQEG